MSKPQIKNPAGDAAIHKPRNGFSCGAGLCADTVSVGCRLANKSRHLSFRELHRISEGQGYIPKSKLSEILVAADSSNSFRSVIEAALVRYDPSAPLAENDIRDFLRMHPGVRELRMRNFVSAGWEEADWRNAVQ